MRRSDDSDTRNEITASNDDMLAQALIKILMSVEEIPQKKFIRIEEEIPLMRILKKRRSVK